MPALNRFLERPGRKAAATAAAVGTALILAAPAMPTGADAGGAKGIRLTDDNTTVQADPPVVATPFGGAKGIR